MMSMMSGRLGCEAGIILRILEKKEIIKYVVVVKRELFALKKRERRERGKIEVIGASTPLPWGRDQEKS